MEHFIVTENCSTMRMLAREALRGRWKLGIIGMLVYNMVLVGPSLIIIWFLPDIIFIALMYTMLVAGPLTLGMSIFVLSIFRNQDPHIGQIFYGFERFGKVLGVTLVVGLIITLWMMVPIILVSMGVAADSPALMLLVLPAMIPAIIAVYRYIQVYFILADYPSIGIMECVGRSKMIMTGNKAKFFILHLSFIGWLILANIPQGFMGTATRSMYVHSFLTFLLISILPMLPMIVVEVYMLTAGAVFYDMVSGNLRPGVITTTAEIVDEEQLSEKGLPEEELQEEQLISRKQEFREDSGLGSDEGQRAEHEDDRIR